MPALILTETRMHILVGLALMQRAEPGAIFPANQLDDAEALAEAGMLKACDTPKGRVYQLTEAGRVAVAEYGYEKPRVAIWEAVLIALVMGWVLSVLLGGTR